MSTKVTFSQVGSNKSAAVASRHSVDFTSLLVSIFFCLGLIGILNHEMWRDELQAWLIARDSSSISDLFNNLKYEGHPALWHIALYLISRVTHNPVAMQLFHLALATFGIYIFAKFSPFKKLQKVLFAFGYFSLFEYCILSRNYAMSLIFIFLFCVLFPIRRRSYLPLAAILFLLANTNVYSLIITIALSTTLLLEYILEPKKQRTLSVKKGDLTISVIIVVFGIILSLIQIFPPTDSGYTGGGMVVGGVSIFNLERFEQTILTVWKSYIPIPNFLSYNFWEGDTNIIDIFFLIPRKIEKIFGSFFDLKLLNFGFRLFGSLFSIGILTFIIALFIRKTVVLFLYLFGSLSILSFTYFKYFGHVRHHGHLFILFIACLWLSCYYSESELLLHFIKRLFPNLYSISRNLNNFSQKYKNSFLTLILCTHLAGGAFAFSSDFLHPFSESKEAAIFIQNQHLDTMLIAGAADYAVSPIFGYLDTKFYSFESKSLVSYLVWNNKRKDLSYREILEQVSKLVYQRKTDIVLVLNSDFKNQNTIALLSTYLNSHTVVSKLNSFNKGIVYDENYDLYLLHNLSISSNKNFP